LTAPDGWLSLTDLVWLQEGENPAPAGPGTIRLFAGRAVFHGPDGAVALESDAKGDPTVLRFGTVSLSVIERGGRHAVRVRDAQSPARRAFRGIASFPVDPRWRFAARFEPYDPPRRVAVPNILGFVDEEIAPGAVVFEAAGATHRLDPILERGESDYWIIFGDATNGRETYGAGRFVYVPPPSDGRTVIDFNKAYNPPCVFTAYSTCPLPPPGNRLPFRVEAGEKLYAASL
jgi:uncharacterized protein